jgi:hypothetical protein
MKLAVLPWHAADGFYPETYDEEGEKSYFCLFPLLLRGHEESLHTPIAV